MYLLDITSPSAGTKAQTPFWLFGMCEWVSGSHLSGAQARIFYVEDSISQCEEEEDGEEGERERDRGRARERESERGRGRGRGAVGSPSGFRQDFDVLVNLSKQLHRPLRLLFLLHHDRKQTQDTLHRRLVQNGRPGTQRNVRTLHIVRTAQCVSEN